MQPLRMARVVGGALPEDELLLLRGEHWRERTGDGCEDGGSLR